MIEHGTGWNERWAVLLECKSCKAQFEVEHPDPSQQLVADGAHRLVLVGAPDECPRCAKETRCANVVDIRARRPAG